MLPSSSVKICYFNRLANYPFRAAISHDEPWQLAARAVILASVRPPWDSNDAPLLSALSSHLDLSRPINRTPTANEYVVVLSAEQIVWGWGW